MTQGEGNELDEGDDPEGLELSALRRESALERLKKALSEREVPTPQLEGYSLQKARKILSLVGVSPERLRVRLVEHPGERGRVVRQRPDPGRRVDLLDPNQKIELAVAESSLLQMLPQLYQRSDLTGRNFIRELLWVIQHINFSTEEKLEHLERYFDPHECPSEFLEYLASWVALTLEAGWPEAKKRSLIKKAVELYHLRGTPRGLRVYLRLFTGVDPQIVENTWPFAGFVVGVTSTIGVDSVLTHRVNPAHAFVVRIPLPIDEVDNQTILRIHRIIEQEKPVHTDYYLIFAEREEEELDSSFTVGVSSTVGVDTWLAGDAAESYFDPLGGLEGGPPGAMVMGEE
ncbi:MAG: phage tail protein [Planctomycetota bacterium]